MNLIISVQPYHCITVDQSICHDLTRPVPPCTPPQQMETVPILLSFPLSLHTNPSGQPQFPLWATSLLLETCPMEDGCSIWYLKGSSNLFSYLWPSECIQAAHHPVANSLELYYSNMSAETVRGHLPVIFFVFGFPSYFFT